MIFSMSVSSGLSVAVQDAAQPGTGRAGDEDGDRVPERTERGLGDVDDHAKDARHDPDESQDQGMTHRRMRGEARRDIAAQDRVDDAVARSDHEERTGHRFTPRRVDLEDMQHLVGADRQDEDYDEPRDHGADAAPPPARKGRGNNARAVHARPLAGVEANSSASRS